MPPLTLKAPAKGCASSSPAQSPKRPGRQAQPIVRHPEALWPAAALPDAFDEALDAELKRHGESIWTLHKALVDDGASIERTTLSSWRRGAKAPATPQSLAVVSRIEARYRLEPGTLAGKVRRARAVQRPRIPGVSASEQRRLAWHLPDDFHRVKPARQAEIIAWVRENILSGGTAYSRYQANAAKQRFGFQFDRPSPRRRSGLPPPRRLAEEIKALVAFKTLTLAPAGMRRSGVWGEETTAQRLEHLGLLFGAMASKDARVDGLGLAPDDLSLALLISPAVWDWYVQWRERRRGFYTRWEVDMLLNGAALGRKDTGWLRQCPHLAAHLKPIPGLLDPDEIAYMQADWQGACDRVHAHCLARAKEVERVARVHRDPFEPLLVVLEASSPLGEYRKIADEILARIPAHRRAPRATAEAVRAFIMVRLGLHTGLRQKNLRQLRVQLPGRPPRTERELEDLRCGELRWLDREEAWEVFVPHVAFKNAGSAYFSQRPFRLRLPDLGRLYEMIARYLKRDRALLLGDADDPGALFIKTVKRSSQSAAYDLTTFYEAWRLTIQRYGIYNPYTGRGAIPGLRPHGPHSVRDVLATHILKQTGSYEQASYAIQDTPATVAAHYGRFLPQDKAALAANILNEAWCK